MTAPTDKPTYAMPCHITGCEGGYIFEELQPRGVEPSGRAVCDHCGDVRNPNGRPNVG